MYYKCLLIEEVTEIQRCHVAFSESHSPLVGAQSWEISAYCWSQIVVHGCKMIMMGLMKWGQESLSVNAFLLFFCLWSKCCLVAELGASIKCLCTCIWAYPVPPESSSSFKRRERMWYSKVVVWCHGKNLGETSLVRQSCGECRSILGRQDPTERFSGMQGEVLVPSSPSH